MRYGRSFWQFAMGDSWMHAFPTRQIASDHLWYYVSGRQEDLNGKKIVTVIKKLFNAEY